MEKKLITTPKAFFIKERDQTYANWTVSFWREFFQNSVDASSKNIKLSIREAAGRGSFDDVGDPESKMTRIVIDDDGVGMSAETLDNVYFAIGQTTKDDGTSVGGYGRARLMTCFSQARYSILTQDRFVMGDGPNYVNYSLDEAVEKIEAAIQKISPTPGSATSVQALQDDLRLIREAQKAGGYNGCRIEVDIDQSQEYRWRRLDSESMANALKEYLLESQIPAKISINDQTPEEYFNHENGKLQARRGQVKRTLQAELNGEIVDFATIHTSSSENALHKGKVIVRVDGAAMYSSYIEVDDVQIILEIDKSISRHALTSNRDGLKNDFREIVNAFIAELNIDNKSALAERLSKDNYTIKGEHGLMTAQIEAIEDIVAERLSDTEMEAASRIDRTPVKNKIETLSDLTARGVSQDAIDELIRLAYYGNGFLSDLRWNDYHDINREVREFFPKLNEHYGQEPSTSIFLKHAPDRLKNFVVSTLQMRHAAAITKLQEENERQLKDMNDVHVSILTTNEKTRAAIRRNDPRKWDTSTGKGKVPRALLASWTTACAVAIETMMRLRPSVRSFNWTSGWVYSVPEDTDQGDRYRQVSIQAMCQIEDGEYRFLLNPIREDGTLKYSINSAKDRQRLQALAMHEVAHVLEKRHNEIYAGVLTDFMQEFDFKDANQRMKEAVSAVMTAYGSAKAHVQALDTADYDGPRPAERLLNHVNANGNDYPEGAITEHEDGSRTIDVDRVAEPYTSNDLQSENDYGMKM